MRIRVDKIGSVTKNVPLEKDLRLTPEINSIEGTIVVGKILTSKTTYDKIEDVNGRMISLHQGDLIVGALGHRNALHQYSGEIPDSVAVGDVLQVLNLGGVIGRCTSSNPTVGKPFDVEILGGVLVFPEFGNRLGTPAHIAMNLTGGENSSDADVASGAPIVFVSGTCMQSGKTFACCTMIRALRSRGLTVAGCKLTGVSLLRDTLGMLDYGASVALSFNDVGIVTSGPKTAVTTARKILAELNKHKPDVIVAEFGDGILGRYGVQEILSDEKIMKRKAAIVLCANDPVGVWGGVKHLDEQYGLNVDLVSGPATDNAAGTEFVEKEMTLRAINAQSHSAEMGEYICQLVEQKAQL